MRYPQGLARTAFTVLAPSGVIMCSFKQDYNAVRTDENYFYYSTNILVFSTVCCFILLVFLGGLTGILKEPMKVVNNKLVLTKVKIYSKTMFGIAKP